MIGYRDDEEATRLRQAAQAAELDARAATAAAEHRREHALEERLAALAKEPPPDQGGTAPYVAPAWDQRRHVLATGRARASKRGKWLAIGGSAALLLVTAAAVWLNGATASGTAPLSADAPGTRFYVDGKLVCASEPCVRKLAAGKHQIRAVAGARERTLSHVFTVPLEAAR